ncbi:DNA-binding response regulator, NarL/FixJ family, contains REC and HTH domains [Paraburkholderia steynii]|uniref:DNA-binding response regulator, NarL/FixJ family, contains REC and HTH domains n=1 Tax=Paraburkholderia steynii TaxID=1245441 RepID=A0A7Z7BMQ6_9BURK|nr:response regulator transcription factor [Paraburkholderia steynii]SDJ51410.1 DNA-binding response regulator, NarL/FixJ family, contains REC and HTH domains [Paraburkholderia steynii]
MNVIVLSPIRMFGDGLATSLGNSEGIRVVAVARDLAGLRNALAGASVQVVLIDVTQGIDLYDMRSVAVEHPALALVALGLNEQRQDVIRCGRAGFSGYVPRDAPIDALRGAIADVAAGRLACPAEISSALLRALFRSDHQSDSLDTELALTQREMEVLHLLGHGYSNKEIARELCLSIATVKHHVHSILDKLKLPNRVLAMRRVRDAPWLASVASRRAGGVREG